MQDPHRSAAAAARWLGRDIDTLAETERRVLDRLGSPHLGRVTGPLADTLGRLLPVRAADERREAVHRRRQAREERRRREREEGRRRAAEAARRRVGTSWAWGLREHRSQGSGSGAWKPTMASSLPRHGRLSWFHCALLNP